MRVYRYWVRYLAFKGVDFRTLARKHAENVRKLAKKQIAALRAKRRAADLKMKRRAEIAARRTFIEMHLDTQRLLKRTPSDGEPY